LTNIKEIKYLCRVDLQIAAQANVRIDAEIGQKDYYRMETTPHSNGLTETPLPSSTVARCNRRVLEMRVRGRCQEKE